MVLSILCISVSVSAAEVYTITLTGTDGDTYDAYMIFSATTTGEEGNEKVGYTLNPDFAGYFTEEFLEEKGYNSAVEYVSSLSEATTEDIDAFAASIMNYAVGNDSITPAGSGKTSIQVESKGYYLIVEETSEYDARSLAILEVATKNETVAVKSSAPTLLMKVYDDDSKAYIDVTDVSFDEEIIYRLTGSISAMRGYTQYDYEMIVDYDDGIDFNSIESVTFKDSSGNTVASSEGISYNVVEGTNTFSIVFSGMKNAIARGIKSVEVEYSATVNADKFILRNGSSGSGGSLSKAVLKYSSDPYNIDKTNTTAADNTMVYSYSMSIHKVDAKSAEAEEGETPDYVYLEGASFKIYSDVDTNNPVYLKATSTPNTYKVVTSATDGAVTEVTTDSTGKITLLGMDSATYYIKETKAPAGYNPILGKINADITTEYTKDGVDKSNGFIVTDRQNLATITSSFVVEGAGSDMPGNVIVRILNNVGGALPQTGGSGTMPFKVYGLSVVLLAGLVLVYLYRSSSKNKKTNN